MVGSCRCIRCLGTGGWNRAGPSRQARGFIGCWMGTTLKTAMERGLPPGWVTAAEAASLMGMDAVTLEYLRKQRRAPTWALLNGDVPIYRKKAAEAWAKGRNDE